MSKFNFNHTVLASSCLALNSARKVITPQGNELYKEAVAAASAIFSSLTDLRDFIAAELIYLETESTFSHPEDKSSFDNAIESYHYAQKILKIITEKPEMYIEYSAPACLCVKTNDKNGVPKDAFRNALASHKTRLQNNKKHGIRDEERTLLSLRSSNVVTALKLYKELQKQVLGL